MPKDLTTSQIDRQNVLNNDMAVTTIQSQVNLSGIMWKEKIFFTRDMAANFFNVDIRTISRYIEQYNDELLVNGYKVIRGKCLKEFLNAMQDQLGKDINVPTKTTVLGILDFRAFLNLAMLLSESEKAKALRQAMLDIVIDIVNQKTGGSTKYINQRDKDFISAYLQEDNYRRLFTDSLKNFVVQDKFKYAYFTDKIYVSIFKEKASEYKKILDLKANDKVRDTFYSEILDIIASYECGLAEAIKAKYEKYRRLLSRQDVEEIFNEFENLPHWKPLICRGRIKMASRDMALREAFHYHLSEYIKPLNKDEYQKFLGSTGDELERLMEENRDVLQRLKER